jgi:hypothetical protein
MKGIFKMKNINLYLEYLAEEAASDSAEAAIKAEAEAEAEAEMLHNMSDEELWIYYHGCNY